MPKWIELFGRVYPYVEEIRAKDAWPSAEKGEIVLLDVREPRDIARFGKCQGAIHMPLHMLRHRADQTSSHFDPALDPAKSFAIYCRTGKTSLQAARMMKKLGYKDVYNMGSFTEWKNAKLPLEK